MSRPERTIIALDHVDAQRFARSLKAAGDRVLFFEEARSWSEIRRLMRQGTGTLVVLGARPPDKAAVRHLGPRADQVVILQHAINRRRSFRELPPGYFRANFRKLVYWSLFSLLCKLVPRRAAPPTHVYHFTPDYRDEWAGALGEGTFSDTPCPRPDPSRFGTMADIPVSDAPVAWQLVDEPFTQTLGISRAQERKLFEMILDVTTQTDDGPIMVKPHPRSQPGKYDFSPRFVTGETLYSHPGAVIGYRSGLLDYPFATDRQLTIEVDGETFRLQSSIRETNHEQCGTYLNVVERDLAAKGY
ncbi:hypothetical protein [Phaeovulum vinaykumarii]|uniref:Uncharacterized protein n=1 Tax=Phaeovulum vinaykumarii TaxID=407234 RepID=A0A1N7N2B2_9RHOB|nr:hypothetical protein [Phaeovulum vinaykumarii]SIS92474.1 hypothetical protein SAMN05421795_11418 [Phaeovulum vinaykumarii]SOC18618.1 hypothetical protein SAMN05878426_11512 [Phaeovulum vinaykumarii]